MGELDQLKQEMVVDLLREWMAVYERAEAVYAASDPETKAWIDERGHRVDSLVSVVATMQPDVRVVCRALVEDALAQLSQPISTIEHAIDRAVAQAKSSEGEMGGVDERMAALEARVAALEAENRQLVANMVAAAAALLTPVDRCDEPAPGSS